MKRENNIGEAIPETMILGVVSRRSLVLAERHDGPEVDRDLVTFGLLDAASERALDDDTDVDALCAALRRVHEINKYNRLVTGQGGEA